MNKSIVVRQFVLPVGAAVAVAIPALTLRVGGLQAPAVLATVAFGGAILAAGFLLSWGAEAAERYLATGFIVALVALITVLPEYAVDFYYALRAGQDPASGYVAYAAANMTGANRMLIGLAWPLMVGLHAWRARERGIRLEPENAVEFVFLAVASLYAFVIVWKNTISIIDFILLAGLFGAYLWRASRAGNEEEAEEADEPGPGAVIAQLSPARRWTVMGAMSVAAAAIILLSAEPFAEALVASGRTLGMDEFLLIQWLAPLASEAPAVAIAVLFVLDGRARAALSTMISDKINQWTLLVGMLPVAMSVGAGHLTALPLDARQHEEFLLTAAQSLFALTLLMRLRLDVASAVILAVLFVGQVIVAFTYRADPARETLMLTYAAYVYLGLAAVMFVVNARHLPGLMRAAVRPSAPRTANGRAAPMA